jgi:hypothetical protein
MHLFGFGENLKPKKTGNIEYYTCKSGKRIYFSSYNSGETCGSHEPRTTRTYLKDVEAIKAYFGEIDQMNEWYCVSSFQCSTWIGVAYLTLIGLLLSVYRVCGSGLSLREVARRERRMKMRYEIEEEDEGGRTIASISVKSERSVRQEIKKWIKADPSNLIFVSWYRTSDGQKGYFNPSGDHDITGKTWEIGQ